MGWQRLKWRVYLWKWSLLKRAALLLPPIAVQAVLTRAIWEPWKDDARGLSSFPVGEVIDYWAEKEGC